MEDLEMHEKALLAALRNNPSLGNGKARQILAWDETTYEAVKQSLVAKGQVAIGQKANRPLGQEARKRAAGNLRTAGPIQPVTKDLEATGPQANRPLGQEASKPIGPQANRPESPKANRPNGLRPPECSTLPNWARR